MRSMGCACLGVCLLAWGACTPFEPGSDELTGESQTLVDAPLVDAPPGQDWSCLSPDTAPAPSALFDEPASDARFVVSVKLLGLVSSRVVPGVTVRACEQRDTTCDNPITEQTPVDAEGWVDLPLYEGFFGYLEAISEQTVPAMIFFSHPLEASDRVDEVPFGVVERAALPNLVQAIGTPWDPNAGIVWLRAFDCDAVPAPGVEFNIDRDDGRAWYFVGSLPSGTVTATAETGLGGYVNVPPGVAVVDAAANGVTLSAPKSLLVRAGWVSGVRIIPSPPAP